MKPYKVRITDPALDDVEQIYRYISDVLLEPQAAEQILDLFEESMQNLSHMPHSRPLVAYEPLAQRGLRKLIVKNYIAFFVIDEDEKTVNIERVLYGRRNWISIL